MFAPITSLWVCAGNSLCLLHQLFPFTTTTTTPHLPPSWPIRYLRFSPVCSARKMCVHSSARKTCHHSPPPPPAPPTPTSHTPSLVHSENNQKKKKPLHATRRVHSKTSLRCVDTRGRSWLELCLQRDEGGEGGGGVGWRERTRPRGCTAHQQIRIYIILFGFI